VYIYIYIYYKNKRDSFLQDLKNLQASATSGSHKEVTAGIPEVACRGMMMEISALQTRVAHLEEEKRTLEEQLGLRFRERYDPLVRHLFATCIQLKVRHLTLNI